MSTPEASVAAPGQVERVPIARYHLIPLAFFLIGLLAQYVFYIKYSGFIPEDIRGLINVFVFTLSFIQSGFMVCVIPLGMVFIFGWLYLMDIEVDLRKLYQITALSVIPLIALMLGSFMYALLFLKIDAATSEQLRALAAVMLQEMKAKAADASSAQEWSKLLAAQRAGYASAMQYFSIIAGGLSCLTCGHLLHKRLNLGRWRAMLIPVTFAVSVVVFRRLTSGGAGQVLDSLKKMVEP